MAYFHQAFFVDFLFSSFWNSITHQPSVFRPVCAVFSLLCQGFRHQRSKNSKPKTKTRAKLLNCECKAIKNLNGKYYRKGQSANFTPKSGQKESKGKVSERDHIILENHNKKNTCDKQRRQTERELAKRPSTRCESKLKQAREKSKKKEK